MFCCSVQDGVTASMCVTSVGQACAAPASSRVAQNGRQKGTWRYKYTLFISVSNARLDTAVVQRVCVCVRVCVLVCRST